MNSGAAVLRSVLMQKEKQNRKLKEKYPELCQQLSNLTLESKQAVIRQHLTFAKYLHTLKLLRWYGEHLHGGDYNVDSFIAVFKEIADMKVRMADQ